jgi:hypothetical protein
MASQDTLQVPPCALDGRIAAANGLEKPSRASSVTMQIFSSETPVCNPLDQGKTLIYNHDSVLAHDNQPAWIKAVNPEEPDRGIHINPVVPPGSVLVATERSPSLGLQQVMDRSGLFVRPSARNRWPPGSGRSCDQG